MSSPKLARGLVHGPMPPPLMVQPPQPQPQPPSSSFQPQIDTNDIAAYLDPARSRDTSPSAPEYSPITPKPHPAVPTGHHQQETTASLPIVDSAAHTSQGNGGTSEAPAIAPTEFVPAPPSQPFSSKDSVDALALRAAISSLQFQKQKAKEDVETLSRLREMALANPEQFAQELLSGRLKEKRHDFGNLQDILDAQQETDDEGEKDKMKQERGDSLVTANEGTATPFPAMPGPQNIVRMPHINWDKYNIMGEPLDALHEQQRRWPGSAPFQQNKGREYSVAAPYSPWNDSLDGHHTHTRNTSDGSRKRSHTPNSVVDTPVAIEHPYETRRSSKHQAQ